MVFKFKTSKTVNKILAGAGIVGIGSVLLNAVSPGLLQGTLGKVILPATAFTVSGVEGLGGALITELAGRASGSRALDNTLTEAL
jgi:hypothetical protein